MEESLQGRIRERAYQIWEAGGRIHSEAEQHWFAAEREIQSLTAEIVAPKPVIASKVTRQRQFITNVQPRPKNAAKAG
jgi:hypothetical protein